MNSNWLYSDDRLALREKCLSVLLKKYGGEVDDRGVPRYSTKSIYECAHDWVSQGNGITKGLTNYYETHYLG